MKRKVLIGGTILALIVGLMATRSPRSKRNVSAIGLGFTNTAAGIQEVLVLIPAQVRKVGWNVWAFGQLDDDGRWLWRRPPPPRSTYQRGDEWILGFPVDSTNVTWGVVVQFRQRHPGWRGIWEAGRDEYDRIARNKSGHRHDGRMYFVTNALN
jgi:hypothetical protein